MARLAKWVAGWRWSVVGLAVVLVVGAVMAWRMWGRVGDPVTDYGRDPYTAWQMAEGRALYRDLAYPYGPLGPFLNLARFTLFGVSLRTLMACNLAVAAGVAAMQFWVLGRMWGSRVATAVSVVWVLVFAFGNMTRIANYNYLTPYTNSATDGYACCVAVVACVCAAVGGRRPGVWVGLAGVAGGLAMLTKVEFVVAAGATLGAGVVVVGYVRGMGWGRWVGLGVAAWGGVVVSVGVALGVMSVHTPVGELVAGTVRAYSLGARPEIRGMESFQVMMGTEFVGRNVTKAGEFFCYYVQVFLPGVLVGLVMRGGTWRRYGWVLGVAVGVAGFAWVTWGTFHFKFWAQYARGVPVVVAVCVGAWGWALWRRGRGAGGRETEKAAVKVVFGVFALAMLPRMALNFRVYQMGFVQAAPAGLLVVGVLVGGVPAMVERLGGYGGLARLVAAGVLCGVVVREVETGSMVLSERTVVVGEGPDRMVTDRKGAVVREALRAMASRGRAGETLATITEGPMLNYLARRANPTRYELVNQFGVVLAGGEGEVLESFRATSPDWVAVVGPDVGEALSFRARYAAATWRWFEECYVAVGVPLESVADRSSIGAGRPFRIQLYRRREPGGILAAVEPGEKSPARTGE